MSSTVAHEKYNDGKKYLDFKCLIVIELDKIKPFILKNDSILFMQSFLKRNYKAIDILFGLKTEYLCTCVCIIFMPFLSLSVCL